MQDGYVGLESDELSGRRSSTSVRDLISLGGGLEVRGKYRISIMRVAPDGRTQMISLVGETGTVGDSDVLFVQPAADQTVDRATLSGGTALAGQYSLRNTKLSEILKAPGALGSSPYTLFGVISRRDPVTLMRSLIAFTPVAVLKGSEDLNVQSDDVVRVISANEARTLLATVTQYQKHREFAEEALRNPRMSASQNYADTQANTQNGQQRASSTTQMIQSQVQVGSDYNLDARQALELSEQDVLAQAAGQLPVPGLPQAQLRQLYPQTQYQRQYPSAPGSQPPNQVQESYAQQLPFDQSQQYQLLQPQPYQQTQQDEQGQPYQQGQQYQPYLPRQIPFAANLEEEQSAPGQVPSNREVTRLSQLATQLHIDPLILVNFLRDHSANIDGAVGGGGLYLVGPDADLRSLLVAAGGMQNWADKSTVEVISTAVDSSTGTSQTQRKIVSLADAVGADYIVSPHDVVRVNKIFTDVEVGSVTMQGQIRHVGTYQIVRGEHLSDLMMRAGGLTDTAYPYGTVFLRRSAAELEQNAFQREASEIEDQLLLAMSRRDPNSKLSPDAFTALQSYITELRNHQALGRVAVVADPTLLAANPAMDPLLEPGDVVYVPQRPYSISVLGQVLQPGSVPFKPGVAASDYIRQAGGYSQFADKSETFVVLPDGSARRVETSWLDFSGDDIPPGSTVYVGRDVSGVDVHEIIVDTISIFSQLATSAAALAVLSKQ